MPKAFRWPLATPVVALATLYFATRYSAANDRTARAYVIAGTLLLLVLAAARYVRSRPRPDRALLAACAVALAVTYLGRWLAVPPFSGWREAIAAVQVGVAAVLFFLTREERRTVETLTRRERIALLLLASLGPALLQAGNNLDFLPGPMLAPYLAALAAYAAVAYGIVLFTAGPTLSRGRLVVLAAAFAASAVFLPSMRAMLRLDGRFLLDFFALFAAVAWLMAAIARRSQRFLVATLAALAVMQVFGIARTLLSDELPGPAGPRAKVPAEIAAATPVDTPNVYVLVYDGMPELQTLEELGFDSTAQRQLLAKHGFELYPGTYSLASSSRASMARTLDMHEQLRWTSTAERMSADRGGTFFQRVRGGDSTTHRLLRHLGYYSYAIMPSYLVGDLCEVDELLPDGVDARLELAATLLRGVLQGEFRADTRGWGNRRGSQHLVAEKLAVIARGHPKRYVESHILVPGHSQNSGRCLPDERELWGERHRRALELMEQDFAAIEQHDPSAIVVAMSDHGPYLTGDCLGLEGWELEAITRLHVLDRYGTMIAIRWPDRARAARYDGDLKINQDVFPTIFAYLYDSPVPLGWKVPREVSWKGHVFLRDGEFIPYRVDGGALPSASAPAVP